MYTKLWYFKWKRVFVQNGFCDKKLKDKYGYAKG